MFLHMWLAKYFIHINFFVDEMLANSESLNKEVQKTTYTEATRKCKKIREYFETRGLPLHRKVYV